MVPRPTAKRRWLYDTLLPQRLRYATEKVFEIPLHGYTPLQRKNLDRQKWRVIEFNPNYTVCCSTCEKGLSTDRDTAYIVELSNGTKFLCFMHGYFGTVQVEELLSVEGEQANIESDQQTNANRTRQNLHLLNGK